MKTKTKILIGAVSAAVLIAGIARATPTVGAWFNVILSLGTVNHDINAHAHVALAGTEEGFSAQLETEGAANFIVQEIKFSPGGTTGWHNHPGILLLSLAADSGPVDWYDANCIKHTYNAGDSWTEATSLHDVVNNSSMDAHFFVTYVVPKGVGKRTDQAAPACGVELGLK
jgi:quercetin dioxygenase-like cupin family protein